MFELFHGVSYHYFPDAVLGSTYINSFKCTYLFLYIKHCLYIGLCGDDYVDIVALAVVELVIAEVGLLSPNSPLVLKHQ